MTMRTVRKNAIIVVTGLVIAVMCERARAADFSLLPSQDAFARASEPTRNFGAAGALAVSGASGVNSSGEPQGAYESILQFDASLAKSAFDAQFGTGNWQLTAARLDITQVGMPISPIFNVGAGQIAIRWISDDNWLQGIGTPLPPPIDGGGNEITWNFLQTLVAGSTTSLLATQAVQVQTGPVSIPLALTTAFSNDVISGGFVSIFAQPVTPTVGFTFFALEYPLDPAARPLLVLTALPVAGNQGDLNCDSTVNTQDMGPFALALTDPDAYAAAFPTCNANRADVNTDGLTDGRDVAAFVDLLINP